MAKNSKEISRAEQKRKEREAKRKKSITESDGTRTLWETICWLGGLFLLLFSLYVFVAAVAHLFVWKNDLGVLANNPLSGGGVIENVCSEWGAKIANSLTGKSFGLFGVLVPVIGMLFGGFLLLERSRVLWRTALSIMLVTICGSLTLATITGADGCFGSGWGGEFGVAIVDMLKAKIGVMGVIFALVACWVVTGIIINLHFIDFLKRTTETSVEQGKGAVVSLKEYLARKSEERKDRKEAKAREDDAVEAEDKVRIIGKAAEEEPEEKVAEEVEEQPVEENNAVESVEENGEDENLSTLNSQLKPRLSRSRNRISMSWRSMSIPRSNSRPRRLTSIAHSTPIALPTTNSRRSISCIATRMA